MDLKGIHSGDDLMITTFSSPHDSRQLSDSKMMKELEERTKNGEEENDEMMTGLSFVNKHMSNIGKS